MSKTETYRRHHDELRSLSHRITAMLDSGHAENAADEIGEVVRQFFAKFSVHLAIEDRSLYPRCASHADGKLKAVASRFQAEMGDLGDRVEAYRKAWPGPLAIGRSPARFVTETREILTLLEARVGREETELYDLVDKAA